MFLANTAELELIRCRQFAGREFETPRIIGSLALSCAPLLLDGSFRKQIKLTKHLHLFSVNSMNRCCFAEEGFVLTLCHE